MQVDLIASTQFFANTTEMLTGWRTDADGGQALAEFAGRACFQSFKKPNPATATNAGYLANIISQGHLSVLEHGSATFYIQGVSRSLTHELIRHRHLSYSQLSQRFVDESDTDFVAPPLIGDDPELSDLFNWAMEGVQTHYTALTAKLAAKHPDASRKQIREAARAVLPNATETKIVATGNYRAWREFIDKRATPAADAEIRDLAVEILASLKGIAGTVFDDYELYQLDDGSMAARR